MTRRTSRENGAILTSTGRVITNRKASIHLADGLADTLTGKDRRREIKARLRQKHSPLPTLILRLSIWYAGGVVLSGPRITE